jgi:hypothetical protein
LNRALVGECLIGVQEIEVHPPVPKPPALHDVAIECGIEEPRVGVALVHEDRLRTLSGGVPVAGEIRDVQGVADEESLNVASAELVLEALDRGPVPLERQPVVLRGGGRTFRARRGLKQEGRALAGRLSTQHAAQ